MTAFQPIETMQRAKGEAFVRLGPARLERLRTEGSAKAILPGGAEGREVVFLNTSGGLTSGDHLRFGLDDAGPRRRDHPDGRACLQGHRHPGADGCALTVGPGGWLDWLPQETILFDRAALDRRTVIDLAAGAGCLALEAVVLGRAAMGETVRDLRFRDRREIRRAGKPFWIDPLRAGRSRSAGTATLNAARAFATIVDDGTSAALAALARRAGRTRRGGRGQRLRGPDGGPDARRRRLAPAPPDRPRPSHPARGRPLPRVWQV